MVPPGNGGGGSFGRRKGITKMNSTEGGKRGAEGKKVCFPDEILLGELWAVRLGFQAGHKGMH